MVNDPAGPRPFLKWAGGKRLLAPQIVGMFPRKIQTYYEPFVGGGAVFFTLAAMDRFQRAVLNDSNVELTNVYRVIRDFPEELIAQVNRLPVTKDCFMQLRARLPDEFSPVRRAARTLFLNRTCYNGLYRVNRDGIFNVSWGDYQNPRVVDPENVMMCSDALKHVHIGSLDFAAAVDPAGSDDVVYFDPPYAEVSRTANFTAYTAGGFSMDDQVRLADLFGRLAKKGVAVIASNSNTPAVQELYAGWEQHKVRARRSINSDPKKRGPVEELIIVGRACDARRPP